MNLRRRTSTPLTSRTSSKSLRSSTSRNDKRAALSSAERVRLFRQRQRDKEGYDHEQVKEDE